jgi:hypothetical protein
MAASSLQLCVTKVRIQTRTHWLTASVVPTHSFYFMQKNIQEPTAACTYLGRISEKGGEGKTYQLYESEWNENFKSENIENLLCADVGTSHLYGLGACNNVSCKMWWKQSSRTALHRCTTITAVRRACACALAIVVSSWNDTRVGIWVYCASVDGWNRRLTGGNSLHFSSLVTRFKPWIFMKGGSFSLLTERIGD